MAVAVAVDVGGGGAVAVAVAMAGLTKKIFQSHEKRLLNQCLGLIRCGVSLIRAPSTCRQST